MKSRRDFLKIAAGAGVAWPLAGCGSGQKDQPKAIDATAAQPAAAGKALKITIKGAFAYVFNDAYSIVEICSVRPPAAQNQCHYVDHPMGLQISTGGTIETQLPKLRDHKGNETVFYAC